MNQTIQKEMQNTQSGADIVISALQANGINSMFALPGGQLDHLFDALPEPVTNKAQLTWPLEQRGRLVSPLFFQWYLARVL